MPLADEGEASAPALDRLPCKHPLPHACRACKQACTHAGQQQQMPAKTRMRAAKIAQRYCTNITCVCGAGGGARTSTLCMRGHVVRTRVHALAHVHARTCMQHCTSPTRRMHARREVDEGARQADTHVIMQKAAPAKAQTLRNIVFVTSEVRNMFVQPAAHPCADAASRTPRPACRLKCSSTTRIHACTASPPSPLHQVAPFSKTGGLGDVMGALPKALAARGHRVMVVTPRYQNYEAAIDTTVREGWLEGGLW